MTQESEKRKIDSTAVSFLEPSSETWYDDVDELRKQLGAPENPHLFPPHFIKKTLVSIGGGVVRFTSNHELIGAGFLFPRNNQDGYDFTLRVHKTLEGNSPLNDDRLSEEVQRAILERTGKNARVKLYVPEDQTLGDGARVTQDGLQILDTPETDAYNVRALQRKIWGVANDDFLYPVDMHSRNFALATSLLAYQDGEAVGFLFGFDKFDKEVLPASLAGVIRNPSVRVESQLMGVLPDSRNQNIGLELKLRQGRDAQAKGVEIINWTFDPLQSANANLNLNKLGGVIFHHYPDYYAFAGANRLNQVVASRFAVTWFVGSPRVKEHVNGGVPDRDLTGDVLSGAIPIVNPTSEYDVNGFSARRIESTLQDIESSTIAIEIPINWTDLQQNNLQLAQEWRNVTDELFQRYIGPNDGQYAISSLALFKDGKVPKRAFLMAKPIRLLKEIYLGQD